jgi:hypothetical protein
MSKVQDVWVYCDLPWNTNCQIKMQLSSNRVCPFDLNNYNGQKEVTNSNSQVSLSASCTLAYRVFHWGSHGLQGFLGKARFFQYDRCTHTWYIPGWLRVHMKGPRFLPYDPGAHTCYIPVWLRVLRKGQVLPVWSLGPHLVYTGLVKGS